MEKGLPLHEATREGRGEMMRTNKDANNPAEEDQAQGGAGPPAEASLARATHRAARRRP